jgi:N4-gp56 family major capsid protein
VLKNDAKKAFDALAQAQFAATKLRAVATATDAIEFTVNGTATATSSYAMTKEHVKLIVDYMKERNIPAFSGDDYYALARPSTYRTLKNNLESLHQYVDRGFGMIMSGEIGRYEGVRFIEQTNIAVGVGSTAGAGAWDVGKSDTAFFFGEDTVAEAIAIPEEIRAKIPTDFGRSRAIAWLYLGGFGIVHTDATQSRIVMWDSKA